MKEAYLKRMEGDLKDAYPLYLASLDEKPYRGFRINTLKINPSDFFSLTGFHEEPVPFYSNGYYFHEDHVVAKDPFYIAGLYYMQEPSAMAPVGLLDVHPGMKVLDLCAAPGSKTTAIAERLQNEGLLVANEINPKRALVLLENIEKQGAGNVIVLNNSPEDIAKTFCDTFDRVLCDAPCSGEGMFRKEVQAINAWSEENVEACALRQRKILASAYKALKPGGILVYSTCTFSVAENEDTIVSFLEEHPDMEILKTEPFGQEGMKSAYQTNLARRIYPMDGGEGQFCIKLKKKDGQSNEMHLPLLKSEPVPKCVHAFFEEHHMHDFPYLYCKNQTIYGGTFPFISTGHLHLLRHQVKLGEVKQDRFEPDHALVMNSFSTFKPSVTLTKEELESYSKGNTLNKTIEKGYVAVCYGGYAVGLAKSDGRILKNKYPKHLRTR